MTKFKSNPLQFAVVREDPEIELYLFKKYRIQNPVMIGSGGCTAFALSSRYPGLPITLIEPNPAQIEWIKKRAGKRGASVNLEEGNFEALFRRLREFIYEFIADKNEVRRLLKKGSPQEWRKVFQHEYWTVAFDLHFNDSILRAMFGPAAIQHAPPGSYPLHFRTVVEKGLLRKDSQANYFLFHILLGEYPTAKAHRPLHLQKPPAKINLRFAQTMAQDFPDFAPHDFVGLSNIFDWSTKEEVAEIAERLANELKKGSFVVYRQLNHAQDFAPHFGSGFEWYKDEARRLHAKDRSLFYSSLHIGRKIK